MSAQGLREVIAFIVGAEAMPSFQWAAKWPEWAARHREATTRYNRECDPNGRHGPKVASSDPRVDSLEAAWHHWCYLPLMIECLGEDLP